MAGQMPWAKAYFRTMKEFTIAHPVELIESLMNEVGFPTRTKARNALKRGEILVNGAPEVKGNLVLEPGVTVSVLDAKDASKLSRAGGVKAKARTPHPKSTLKAPYPVVYEDDFVFV